MIFNEITTYKTGVSGLIIVFLLAIIIQENFTWIIGIVLILSMLIVRVNLGEVTKRNELFFVLVIITIMFTTVILMLL